MNAESSLHSLLFMAYCNFTLGMNAIRRHSVKLSLPLTKYQAMKTCRRVEVQLHAFLTSSLDGGEWSASWPDRFTSMKRVFGTHLIGGWVGPKVGLDAGVKRKKFLPCRGSNPDRLACNLVTTLTELPRLSSSSSPPPPPNMQWYSAQFLKCDPRAEPKVIYPGLDNAAWSGGGGIWRRLRCEEDHEK
jgi:hypothetical protein